MNVKINSVQHLRGIAALLVVVAHAFFHPYSLYNIVDLEARLPWTWFGGRLGVTLFFVISGFIMTIVMPGGKFSPSQFFLKRLLRIVPLYWTITIFAAVLSLVSASLFKNTIFDLSHLLRSLFFVPTFRPAAPENVEPFVKLGWTLNYEMFFYAVCAMSCFLGRRSRTVAISLLFIALVVMGRMMDFSSAPAKFYTGYDLLGFVSGLWAGLLYKEQVLSRVSLRLALGAMMSAVGMLAFLFISTESTDASIPLQILLCTLSGVLILACVKLELHAAWPESRFLQTLGNASYSVYLIHMFPIGAVRVLSHYIFGASFGFLDWMVAATFGIVTGILGGLATYFIVEKPLVKMVQRRSALPGVARI
jgi:exopolysaccharide production protein ExoZ